MICQVKKKVIIYVFKEKMIFMVDNFYISNIIALKFLDQLQKKIDNIKVKISRMKNDAGSVDIKESLLQPKVAFGENLYFPSASAGIEVKYAPEKGRCVVANKHIQKGQILFVEKAFAFVPIKQTSVDALDNICHNCCHSCDDIPVP